MINPTTVVDVSQLIEKRRYGAAQWWMLILCLIVITFDGFDAQIMGYTAPALVHAWHVDRSTLGPALSAGLFGLMLGALILGTLGDRIGRKTIILISAGVFGVFSILTGFAQNLQQMTLLRFVTGLGLGGAMPGCIALVSEYTPARLRGTMVTVAVCGFAIGPALGGFGGSHLIHAYGWRAMFLAGGIPLLLLVPILWWVLPESARFMIARGESPDRISASLKRMFPDATLPADATYTHPESALPKAPVREVFAGGRAWGTLLLWVAIFFNLVGINLQSNWLPLTITDLGYSLSQAVTSTAMFHVGGALGGLVLARFLDRFDQLRTVAVIGLLAAVCTVTIGFFESSLAAMRVSIFLAGLFVVGGQCALNALSGMFYPSHIRSTGSGWALGIGRFGAAVGPLVGGALLAMHFDTHTLFYLEAIPFLLVGVSVYLIRGTGQRPRTDAASDPVLEKR